MDWSRSFADLDPPLEQQDGPVPIAPIAYSDDYRTAMGYFRSLAVLNEFSKRALDLSSFILQINSAHYTIWHYRWLILKHLDDKKLWEDELLFLDEFIEDNRKNYQVWRHRQLLVEYLLPDEDAKVIGTREMEFVGHILSFDEKNYHAWTYRQWIIRKFDRWDEELNYIDYLLDRDVRNNSAWNQRYFVKFNNPHCQVTRKVIAEEIQFAFSKISASLMNESPWNYVEGIIDGYKFAEFAEIEKFVRNLITETDGSDKLVFAYGLLLEVMEENGNAKEYQQICEKLCTLDPIRCKYWLHRRNKFE